VNQAFQWPELRTAAAEPAPPREALEAEARDAGHAAGYQQGLEEGRAAAAAELDVMRRQLQASVEALEQQSRRSRQEELETLAQLAHALCRKVVSSELRTTPELFESLLNEALARLDAGAEGAELYLNPDDHAWFQSVYHGAIPMHPAESVPPCGLDVRTARRAVVFDPLAVIDQVFEVSGGDVAG
jgi:flagellar biosynthesis/type III secretory pathway protein FliH